MAANPALAEDWHAATGESTGLEWQIDAMQLPMRAHFGRVLSDAELLSLCRANKGLSIEGDADGSITFMSPAGLNSSRLAVLLASELRQWAADRGIVGGADLGVRFSDGVLRAPDCAWISPPQLEALRDKQRDQFLPFCPVFVAEVRSPSDRASACEAKMELWMSRGAELGWLIDPLRRLAMIYRPGKEPEMLHQPDQLAGEGPIAGLKLSMREFWK